MTRRLLALLLSAVLLLTVCAGALADWNDKTSSICFYFDTVITFTAYGADDTLFADMDAACARYEQLLSKTVEGSDVWRINHAGGEPVTVSEETWNILHRAKEISELTGGAFCVTIAPVAALWDFTGANNVIPDQADLDAALALVDDSALILGDDYTVTLPAGMEIDLGGIAKGYIADQLSKEVEGRATAVLLNFGSSSIYCVGVKPNGSRWTVGVTDPANPNMSLLRVSTKQASVTSSGTYERFFELDGVRYHHILDPQTGISAHTGVEAVTIITGSAMDADAVATACIVVGKEGAFELMEKFGFDGLVIDSDGQVSTTEGFEEQYQMVFF